MNELTPFYKAYAAWLDAGAPDGKPFYRTKGLCQGVVQFYPADGVGRLLSCIMDEFSWAGLAHGYPFGREVFSIEAAASTMHLNPARIAWVRERCK